MKTCANCYWYEQCGHLGRCEFYFPLVDDDGKKTKEYKASLVERARDYKLVVDEQNEEE